MQVSHEAGYLWKCKYDVWDDLIKRNKEDARKASDKKVECR